MIERFLEITTPPVETKLTTQARLLTEHNLAVDAGAGLTATFFDQVIDTTSAAISAYLNRYADEEGARSIGRQTVTETFYGVQGLGYLGLGRWPIANINSVSENDAAARLRLLPGTDGVAVATDATFTSAGFTFTEAMEGKAIVITGAGTAGAALSTTIATFTDENTVELTDAVVTAVDPAAFTVANPAWNYKAKKVNGFLYKTASLGFECITHQKMAVEYDCGWILPGQTGANLPPEIEAAALLMAGERITDLRANDPLTGNIRSEDIEDVGRVEYSTYNTPAGVMSPAVRSLLDNFANPGYA